MTQQRKRTRAIVPRTFFAAGLATAVPACAAAMMAACADDASTTPDYTNAADAPSDRIFIGDVTAHFDTAPPGQRDAADAADDAPDGDGGEEAG